MATNWVQVRNSAIGAAENSLGASWDAVSSGATAQIGALIQVAQYIQQNEATFTSDQYNSLLAQQKIAFQNTLTGYEAIGIAAAQNAASAVMSVILAALPGLIFSAI
ncbi:hypothetical protein [Paraburkholderia heleia]|uniref:hypothetical protein n=1 Tax=Paraburkholderia heleia TaxID=634127 RepID=UPI002AB6FA38|nr:hypothetical protein [Paraburkholderia heleia]